GTSGIVELAGPTGLEIALQKRTNTVLASSMGGRQIIARVALDDGESVVTRRGRIRVGAPLSAQELAPQESAFQPSCDSVLSQGGGAPDSAPTVVASAQGSVPSSSSASSGAASASGSTTSAAGASSAGKLDSSGGSDQTLVATAVEGSVVGAQAGSAISDMTSASSSAGRASSSSRGSSES